MPEGPSIIILKELIEELNLEGEEIIKVSGNSKIDKERLLDKEVMEFKSWGKQFFICMDNFSLRIHFLLFGTYRINERRENPERLRLNFKNAEINFYACSVKFIEEDLDDLYDWSADIMSFQWNPVAAFKKVKEKGNDLICDVLLDQNIFSGVGNIIKNEILYRTKIQPSSEVQSIPDKKLKELIKETRIYCFDFLKWKKEFTLKKHWRVHTKKTCPLGHSIEKAYLGKTNRRSFTCTVCQTLYKKT